MQKIIGLLLILGMAVTAVAIPNIAEAVDDTFDITVTISFLTITLRDSGDSEAYGTWALGAMSLEGTKTMVKTTDEIYVDVGESSAYTLSGKVTSETDWAANATIGTDLYVLKLMGAAEAAAAPEVATSGTVMETSGGSAQAISGGTGALGVDIRLYAHFMAPDETTTGAEQTMTVTITIEAA